VLAAVRIRWSYFVTSLVPGVFVPLLHSYNVVSARYREFLGERRNGHVLTLMTNDEGPATKRGPNQYCCSSFVLIRFGQHRFRFINNQKHFTVRSDQRPVRRATPHPLHLFCARTRQLLLGMPVISMPRPEIIISCAGGVLRR